MKILLITSTISPMRSLNLSVYNVQQRLSEYRNAFSAYIQLIHSNTIDKIVYADNSGYDLSDIEADIKGSGVGDSIELLSFTQYPLDNDSRFYLELQLIQEAMRRSRFINAENNPIIWKVSGRYLIINIDEIIRSAPCEFDLYINFRNYPLRWVDTYIMALNYSAWDRIVGVDISIYQKPISGEIILRQRLDALNSISIARRLRVTPNIISGSRGYNGVFYNSPGERLKYIIRRTANSFTPWIWI